MWENTQLRGIKNTSEKEDKMQKYQRSEVKTVGIQIEFQILNSRLISIKQNNIIKIRSFLRSKFILWKITTILALFQPEAFVD